MSNPRIIYDARLSDLTQGVVQEQIAEQVIFQYDPMSGDSTFTFQSRPYLYINGQPRPLAGTRYDNLLSHAAPIMNVSFGQGLFDPITGADLGQITVAGFALYLKSGFGILYNQRARKQGYPDPSLPYPSELAIAQANGLYAMFGEPTPTPSTPVYPSLTG